MLKLLLVVLLVAIGVSTCRSMVGTHELQAQNQLEQERANKRLADLRESCNAERAAIIATVKQGLADNKPGVGISQIERCNTVFVDAEVQGLLKEARVAMYRAVALDSTNSADARIDAVFKVQLFDNEEFRKMGPLLEKLRKVQQVERAAEIRREAAEKRKRGVHIGMTREEVIASSWGRPRKVNTTTTATTTREQWVYDGGYLYFTDGILTTIQN